MGDLMGKYTPYKGKYDTPTDGISRKKFDRAMDQHIRRYATLSNELAEFRVRLKRIESRVLLSLVDKDEE